LPSKNFVEPYFLVSLSRSAVQAMTEPAVISFAEQTVHDSEADNDIEGTETFARSIGKILMITCTQSLNEDSKHSICDNDQANCSVHSSHIAFH
jgi:hypothetical protein